MKQTKNQLIELDLLGQFFASIVDDKQPGGFSITAHLKEPVQPEVLQQAVNDLMRRLPFLCGRLRRGFFWFYHEVLAESPQIIPISGSPVFSDYYNRGNGHVLRVLYGEKYFKVETLHSICDGGGLIKIISALLLRYFELLGIKADKTEIVDCAGAFQQEEIEDAYKRFADFKLKTFGVNAPKAKAFHPDSPRAPAQRVITQKFDADKIIVMAKEHNTTITEYILAHIFMAIAKERAALHSKKPIIMMVPINCRSFFPTKTFRNFLCGATIIMPETEDFSEMLQQIHQQFACIDKDLVQRKITGLQKLYKFARFSPIIIKGWIMKIIQRSQAGGLTSGFSNTGLIKLPKEIESRIDMLEFILGLEHDMPYFFSCITIGNTLALTTTIATENIDIAEKIKNRITSCCA